MASNKKYGKEDGVWRTIGGRRVFIRTGQNLSSAMKESGKFGKSLKQTRDEYDKEIRKQQDESRALNGRKNYAQRKFGELSEEYDTLNKEYTESQDKIAKLKADKTLAEHETVRRITNVDLPNEFGVDIKQEQFDRLKEVGNINKNQADYENAFIDHKKKMAEMGKYEYFDNRYNKAYDEAMNAQDKFNTIDKNYESMYGKQERDRMFQQSMDTMDRATEGKKRSQEFKKGKEIKEMLRANETNQDDLWNRTGYNFNDLKNEENFNEANRLLGNNYQKVDKEWTDLAKKMEKDYDEFGTTNWRDEKRLNELSAERDRLSVYAKPELKTKEDFIERHKQLELAKDRVNEQYEIDMADARMTGNERLEESAKKARQEQLRDIDRLQKENREKYEKMEYSGVREQTEDLTKINEKTTYDFGKIDAYGNGRKSNRATIDMQLKDGVFTASGSIWNSKGTDIISGGQNLDELKEHFGNDENFNSIYNMWKKYHLNDMHAGTEKQEEALMKRFGNMNANNYDQQVEYLKSIGLYEDNGYRYGSGWLKRDIPQEDLKTISSLIRNNNLKERYSNTYNTLKELGLSEAEIIERLKKIDKKDKKGK